MPRPTFVPANRAQARVVAAAAEVGAEKRGLQVAAPRRGASCASPMRYIAPREDSRASVASKYVRARSATPLVRRTLQNPDARISLTFAATVVATANTELWDLDGPRRQVKEDTPAPSRRARTRALRLKPSAAPRRRHTVERSAVPRARPRLGGGSSNGARGHKYRGDLRSAPTRPPPGPVAGRPSRPLYDDTGPFCPPIALGRAPGGGGSAAWAGGTIGASLAHGDLLNTCLGWPGTVGRPYSAAGLGSGGAPRPCGAAPRGDPTKRPSAGRCGTIGAIWRFRGVGPRV